MSRQCSSPDLFEKHSGMNKLLTERRGLEYEPETFSPDIFEEHRKLPSFLGTDDAKPSSLSLSAVFSSPDLLEEYRSRIPVRSNEILDEHLPSLERDTFSSETPVEATPETKASDGSKGSKASSQKAEEIGGKMALFSNVSIQQEKPVQDESSASPLVPTSFEGDVHEPDEPGQAPKLPKEATVHDAKSNCPSSDLEAGGGRDSKGCKEDDTDDLAAVCEPKVRENNKEEQGVAIVKKGNRVKLVKSRASGILKLSCEGMLPPSLPCDKKPAETRTLAKAKSNLVQMDFNYDYDSSQSQSQSMSCIELSAQKAQSRQSLLSDENSLALEQLLQLEPKESATAEAQPSLETYPKSARRPPNATSINRKEDRGRESLEHDKPSTVNACRNAKGHSEDKRVSKSGLTEKKIAAKALRQQSTGTLARHGGESNWTHLSSRTPAPQTGALTGPSLFSTAKGKEVKLSSASIAKSLSWLNKPEGQDSARKSRAIPATTSKRKAPDNLPLKSSDTEQSTRMQAPMTAVRGQCTSLFSTATGRKLTIKGDALARAQRSLDSENSEKPVSTRPNALSAGRENASNKSVSIMRTKALQVRPTVQVKRQRAASKASLFSTAKGTPVVMSKESLLKAQKALEDPESALPLQRKLLQTPGVQLGKVSNRTATRAFDKTPKTTAKTPSLFATAKGTRVTLTEAAVRNAHARLAADDGPRFETPMVRAKESVRRDSILTVRKPTASLFSTAKGSSVEISAAGLERANKVLRESNSVGAKQATVRKPARQPKKRGSKFVTPRISAPAAPKQQEKPSRASNGNEQPKIDKPSLQVTRQRKSMTLASLRAERAAVSDVPKCSIGVTWFNAHLVVFHPVSRTLQGLGCEGLGWDSLRRELLAKGAPINERQASEKWVKSHYRCIVWKLHGLGRLFPHIPGLNRLNADVVLQQLLQRYTREHVQAQRPALRKIMEHDMPYGTHIIVCVAAVVGTRHLIISDGWYGMLASIDSSLQALVARDRIVPGFKLHVCGASMKNNVQGIDPFDALVNNPVDTPFDASAIGTEAMLCLTANCTKPARWNARMGWQKGRPLMKRLWSIVPTGGTVPLIKGVISRVYPLVFSEKYPDGRRLVRNEREEELRREEHAEQQRSANEEVMQKLRQEWGESFSAVGEEQRRDMISKALNEAELRQRSVNRLLRFRLLQPSPTLDAASHGSSREPFCFYCKQGSHPSSACPKPRCHEAEVSIWNPSEDVVSIAKEGAMALGLSVVPNGLSKRLNLLRLTTSRWTRWKVQPLKANTKSAYGYVPRGLTEIGAVWTLSMTSSFDTVGCIAHVQEIISPEQKKCTGYHVFLISNQSKSRPLSFTYHCANVDHPPQGLITKGNVVAVRDILFESVDPATGISACSFLSSSSFTSRLKNLSTSGWRHLAGKFKELEAWASHPKFAEEITQASKQLAARITSGRGPSTHKNAHALSPANPNSRKQSPLGTAGVNDKILPQKRKSMSKDEKKMQRLKVAQAKKAAWKKKHTKENNSMNAVKRTEIRANIKYELLSYIMLGKKSILIRLRTGIYKSLKRGDLIHFQSGPQSQSCTVRTTQPYDSLEQLLEHETFRSILPSAESKERCMEFLLETYSAESISSCGVVAIHLTFPN